MLGGVIRRPFNWQSRSKIGGMSVTDHPYAVQNALNDWCYQRSEAYPLLHRFVCKPGDVQPDDAIVDGYDGHRERDELGMLDAFRPGVVIWLAFDLAILNTEPCPTGSFDVLGQMHHGYAGLSPPLSLNWRNDKFTVQTRTTNVPGFSNNAALVPTQYDIVTLPDRFRWYRMLAKMVLDSNPAGAGMLQWWLDGVKVIDYTGPISYADSTAPYWKFGIYRGNCSQITDVVYQDVRVGYEDLSARITRIDRLPSLLDLS